MSGCRQSAGWCPRPAKTACSRPRQPPISDIPNIRQKGTRLGNWLTREQAKELLAVPDRSTLRGKRDYVILALLVGCALRRQELASLDVEIIQLREGRWVLADLEGKGRRTRTVAVPMWVKLGINAWMTAAAIEDGPLVRLIAKGGKVGKSLVEWSVWSVVEQSAKAIAIERYGAHDLRRICAKLCRKSGGDLEQMKFLLGHSSISNDGAVSRLRAGDLPWRRMIHWGFDEGSRQCAHQAKPGLVKSILTEVMPTGRDGGN